MCCHQTRENEPLIFALSLCVSLTTLAQKKLALIVAVGNYMPNSNIPPISSLNDVKYIKAVLHNNGFLEKNIDTLKDSRATKAAILKALDAIAAKEVPRITVTNPVIKVQQNQLRGGIAIYPSFNLKSNAKLGTVFFIARLVDENDYYIPTTSENYNLNGFVATYSRATVLPNSNVIYNKTGMKPNLELFIPYSYIPLPNDSKVKVEYFMILSDEVNKQYKDIGSRYYTQLFNISK